MTEPVRTCVGCRERAPAGDLLRVVARDATVVPDPARRLPGRGAHLHRDLACLALAERRRALPRALRVPGPLDLAAVRDALGPTEEGEEERPGLRDAPAVRTR